jgi:elongation factor 3
LQVKKAAWTTMGAIFKLQGNRDIEPCVPSMLSCIAKPQETPDAITKLSGTTFVQVRCPQCVGTAFIFNSSASHV